MDVDYAIWLKYTRKREYFRKWSLVTKLIGDVVIVAGWWLLVNYKIMIHSGLGGFFFDIEVKTEEQVEVFPEFISKSKESG